MQMQEYSGNISLNAFFSRNPQEKDFQSHAKSSTLSFRTKSTSDNSDPFKSSQINSKKFFHEGSELRKLYFEKLMDKNIYQVTPKRKYNSIIIFDWDDTLLCSSYIIKHNLFDFPSPKSSTPQEIKKMDRHKERIAKLEFHVLRALTLALNFGDVYIITNATKGWVEFSAQKYYPSCVGILDKINIISARSKFEEQFPDNSKVWKKCAFLEMGNSYSKNFVTNIICLGDSDNEMEAANLLSTKFQGDVYLKTVKFREEPKPEQIIKQLNLVVDKFEYIHSSVRNITIKVEKKENKDEKEKE